MGLASNRVGISLGKTNLPEASNVCRVLLTVNAGARNIISEQETKSYAQKYMLAWETVPMGNKCWQKQSRRQPSSTYFEANCTCLFITPYASIIHITF